MVHPCTAARRYVWPTNKLLYHKGLRNRGLLGTTDPVTASHDEV